MLWNGLSSTKDGTTLNHRDKLRFQIQALSFLLLLDRESTVPPSYSKAPIYTEDALVAFENSCGTVTKEDASFLLQETHTLFSMCWTGGRGSDGSGDGQSEKRSLAVLSEVLLVTAKLLCKAGHWDLAHTLLDETESKITLCGDCHRTPLVLGKWAVKTHSSMTSGEENGQAFTECARALRSLPVDLGDQEAHAILEGCSLMVWAVDSGHSKGLSGSVLLAWFSFLEEHQEQIFKVLQKVSVVTSKGKDGSPSFVLVSKVGRMQEMYKIRGQPKLFFKILSILTIVCCLTSLHCCM